MQRKYLPIPLNAGAILQNKLPKLDISESIKQNIELLITSIHGENKNNSEYGCCWWDNDFDLRSRSHEIKEQIEIAVYKVIFQFEKRVHNIEVSATTKQENINTVYGCKMKTKVMIYIKGIVFFNPEYGERLGDEIELEQTYSAIGDFLKNECKGYTGYVFTGNLNLAKKIGLKPKRRIEFFNGKIDCRLLEYELYSGSKRINKLDGI